MTNNMDPTSSCMSVALIVPDAGRRRALTIVIAGTPHCIAREFGDNSTSVYQSAFANLGCDVAIVDLDGDTELALCAIQNICSSNAESTVMAYSSRTDLALVRRAMRAGARDFLAEPLQPETVKEAFARISTRGSYRPKEPGKLLVFVSAKSGVGTTNIAANFAIALTKESRARVVVVDLDLQLGDLALGLGLTASCSIADAVSNPARLDRELLAKLLMRHQSGLAVLGSPDEFRFSHFPDDNGVDKLFSILREEFDYVVVDTGTCHGHVREALVAMAHTLYIVTERNFPALRNAHRLVSHLSGNCSAMHMELVLNRFDAPHSDISDEQARKAIGRPINWRIPDGHAAVQKAWDKGVPLALENSPIASVLGEMARTACGKPSTVAKTSRMFSFLDWKARTASAA